MQFKEIEFKYNAANIDLASFIKLIESLFPGASTTLVSSYDDYYCDSVGNFIRHRYNNTIGELTIKRKVIASNNNERIEVNLPVVNTVDTKIVESFVDLLGYKPNFSIYKTSKIYWVDKSVFAYYVVYDRNMSELARFIEIEADEDHEWESEQVALEHITAHEKLLKPISISPQNRLKKSLFEMFKK